MLDIGGVGILAGSTLFTDSTDISTEEFSHEDRPKTITNLGGDDCCVASGARKDCREAIPKGNYLAKLTLSSQAGSVPCAQS